MKKTLTLICTLVVLACCIYIALPKPETFLGATAISQEVFDAKVAGHTEQEFAETFADEILFESAALIYEQTSDCYFISVGESVLGNFIASSGISLYWIGEDTISEYQSMIQQDGVFTLGMVQGEAYAIINIKITTLPLISITAANMPQETSDYSQKAVMTVITPYDETTGQYVAEDYDFIVRVRGQTSTAFPKKSYKINLINEWDARAEESFFGMRNDNDWVLNAIYGDDTRLRELSCLDLYQDLAAEENTENMYPQESVYCEVIINGSYQGLYLFSEHMDAKQLEINEETDIVYKTLTSYMPSVESLADYQTGTNDDVQKIEIKYVPDALVDTSYTPLAAFLTVLPYCSMEPTYSLLPSSEGVSLAEVQTVADLDNLIDMSIFTICLDLWDNDIKNMMLTARMQEDGSYLFYKDFFDFNYSFGDIFTGDITEKYTQDREASEIEMDYVIGLLLNGPDAEEVAALYQARYAELRESVFSQENITATLSENQQQIDMAGGYLRELEKWGEDVDAEYESERIYAYVTERLLLVDEYVAALGQ
ncbi:MAG: CotH kinase family protein [Faecalibacterium sp.]